MRLVENWRSAWKWISVHCMAWAIALQGAWEACPDSLKAGLNPKLVTVVTVSLLVLGILGRLVKQEKA